MRTAIGLLLLVGSALPVAAREPPAQIQVLSYSLRGPLDVVLEIVGPDGGVTWRCTATVRDADSHWSLAPDAPCAHPTGWFRARGRYTLRSHLYDLTEDALVVDGNERLVAFMGGDLLIATRGIRVVTPPAGVSLTRAWRPSSTAVVKYRLENRALPVLRGDGDEVRLLGHVEQLVDGRWRSFDRGSLPRRRWQSTHVRRGEGIQADDGVVYRPTPFPRGRYRFVVRLDDGEGERVASHWYELDDEFTID